MVFDVERVCIPEVLISLVLLSIPKEELAELEHHFRVSLIDSSQLDHVVLGLRSVTVELFILLCETLVSLREVFLAVALKGDQAVSLTRELLLRNSHVFVQLVLFSLNNFLHCESHLLDEVGVELRIEVVSFILVKTLDSLRILFVEMLFNDANYRLLHLFLHDVVLSRGVNFIKEFLFTLLKSLGSLFL